LVSTDSDENNKIWDAKTYEFISCLAGNTRESQCLCVSPDSKHIISGSHDGCIKIWDFQSRKLIRTIEAHSGMITNICILSYYDHALVKRINELINEN
jgi:WD40 repeat protein